jgi:hypothetical protein
MADVLTQYFRCPDNSVRVQANASASGCTGFFSFGRDAVCYGKAPHTSTAARSLGELYDASRDVTSHDDVIRLGFDPEEVIANLRGERYSRNDVSPLRRAFHEATRNVYYSIRPVLSVAVRRHLQKLSLNGWRDIPFPRWPVETTVDTIHRELLLRHFRIDPTPIPFIWFWPQGAEACVIMTHDVETQAGVDFCPLLMDINDSFMMPASFQVVPERRYNVSDHYLCSLRDRGYEINVQDLYHDGHLFHDEETFRRRVKSINQYGVSYGACGFRSAVLYHNQDWYNLLDFEYDMSVPNVGHLDPQRGGCCTVMPYFVDNILELPVTTTQDYSLFHILNDYSLDLWKQQIQLIRNANGLISFIVHPDYIIDDRPRRTYSALLEELSRLRADNNVWIALPGEVNRWWRQRSQMHIVERDGRFHIEGPGSERAWLSFASSTDGVLTYQIAQQTAKNIVDVH